MVGEQDLGFKNQGDSAEGVEFECSGSRTPQSRFMVKCFVILCLGLR